MIVELLAYSACPEGADGEMCWWPAGEAQQVVAERGSSGIESGLDHFCMIAGTCVC